MINDRQLKKYEGYDIEYCVPEGIKHICDLAFSGADRLEKLVIPESVDDIGNYVFMNCYSLREIILPKKVSHLGAGLFQNCWQLRSVDLPNGTITLGADMFENCHSLAEINIPPTLEHAARTSLSCCRSLRKIYIEPSKIELLPPSARYIAVISYMEENSLSSDACGIIDAYVRERQRSFLDLAVNRRSTEAVRYMISRGLADETVLREYLQKSAASGRTEISALLLEAVRDMDFGGALSEDHFE